MTDAPPSARFGLRFGGLAAWAPFVFAVWAIVALRLGVTEHAALGLGYGDSDDATRLVMVRDLLHGQRWYAPTVTRFQPPRGVIMHWSRLLDGALAAVDGAFGLLFGPARGEALTRLLWPLLLIGPALAAVLATTARLAGPRLAAGALWAATVACAVSLPLYAQFHPGRIDHHNVQIMLWLVAFAGAARGGVAGAAAAGVASGVGLAVGLEAMLLHAAIAGFLALRFLVDPMQARPLRAYAVALLAAAAIAFLAQTPPERWSLSACDAMGLNLTAGVALGAAVLAMASFAQGAGVAVRVALVGAAGVAAVAVYLALDPLCARGPFAAMNPALNGVWLDSVQEVRSLPVLLRADPPTGATILAAMVIGPLAWLALGLDPTRRRAPAWWLGGLMLALSAAAAFAMLRMASYLFWAAVPPVAVAAATLVSRLDRGGRSEPVRAVLFGLLLAPTVVAAVGIAAMRLGRPTPPAPPAAGPPDRCFETAAYAGLAGLPAGRVLAEPDLGPFVLAATPSAAIAGPYHRMDFGILAAHAAFAAGAEAPAQAQARSLGAAYVVDCPAHDAATPAPAGRLRRALVSGAPPSWLDRVSPPGAALTIWRVRPPSPMQRP